MKPIYQLKNQPKSLRQLFRSEKRWAKNAEYKDSTGEPTYKYDRDLFSCCLVGGLKLVEAWSFENIVKIEKRLNSQLGFNISISKWNDDYATFEDVQELINDLKL